MAPSTSSPQLSPPPTEPSISEEQLYQLADAYGIDTQYTDAFGNTVNPPNEAIQKLLAVFGVAVETDAEARQALQNKFDADAQQILKPTYVVSLHEELTGQEIGIPIQLPTHLETTPATWQITLEDGQIINGTWQPRNGENPYNTQANNTWATYFCRFAQPLPYGYHQFQITVGELTATQRLIITPHYCTQPPQGNSTKQHWGLAVQLYAQQSQQNLGIGNFDDLTHLLAWTQQQGGHIVGVNPLHSLFPSRPGHNSPYSPASRLFLNVCYIAPQTVAEFPYCPAATNYLSEHKATLSQCRQGEFVNYEDLSPILLGVYRRLFKTFQRYHVGKGTDREAAFIEFCQNRGKPLENFATFMAISEVIDQASPHAVCWWNWPEALQDANSTGVEQFRTDHADTVQFYQYLQFIATGQLTQAQTRAKQQGMTIGLYGDLAVGSDVSGADVWMNPDLYATNIRVGCPPDDCNRLGQDWGLPPMRPDKLLEQGLEPWAALLKANMALFGAIRIDHAMAMLRLFWIPDGMNGTQGTYIRYPYYELLGVLALESHRNQCVVIGEDLGTVPPVIGETFPQWGIHSYKLLYFERQANGGFIPPEDYPQLAMATVTTHDLATLPGFWVGADIDVRKDLDLYPTDEVYQGIANARPEEKQALMNALHKTNLWPNTDIPEKWTPELTTAVNTYLAQTPCQLRMVQLEDLVGQVEQVNLPGTVHEHPNWQRKLPIALEELDTVARRLSSRD